MNRQMRNRELYSNVLKEKQEHKYIHDKLDLIIKQLELIIKLFEIEERNEVRENKLDEMLGNPIEQLEELFNLDNYRREK